MQSEATKQSTNVVQHLWRYCNILRDDGLSYPDYVEQLTYLLFLKMAQELSVGSNEAVAVPDKYGWESLLSQPDNEGLYKQYGIVLKGLARGAGMLGTIFSNATNKIRDPAKLALLVRDLIDRRRWTDLGDVKGDAYEGLLEKNAQDTKSGAGQYFTPRPIVDAVVEVMRPSLSDTICDPACGSCGFLVSSVDFIRRMHRGFSPRDEVKLRLNTVRGFELVPEVARLGAMNLFLHGIGPRSEGENSPITVCDSLREDPVERFKLVLTNPPFGRKSSVMFLNEADEVRKGELTVARSDFWASTSNKQLNFLQHIVTILKPGGRAAVVVPDNVLFEGGAGEVIRKQLLLHCDVHTLLRLPAGIFYAAGVKANVLFFDKPVERSEKPNTKRLWIYDLRMGFRVNLRSNPIQRRDLDEFVSSYCAEDRDARRELPSEFEGGERWRAFDYDEIVRRPELNLDISWLRDKTSRRDEDADAATLAAAILDDLRGAMTEIEAVVDSLKR